MMTRYKVLLPLDGSAFSRQIVGHVRRLFRPTDHELFLLRVAPLPVGIVGAPPKPVSAGWMISMYEQPRDLEYALHPIYSSQLEQNERAAIEAQLLADQQHLERAGYTASVAVRFGDPAEEIVDFARRAAVDSVAMATHGRSGLRRFVIGSVAEQVLRQLAIPVLLIRPSERMAERMAASSGQRRLTAIVPLDGSRYAEQALDHACGLAKRSGARLLLLAVEPAVGDTALAEAGLVPFWTLADQAAEIARLDEYLKITATQVAREGLAVETRLIEGTPAEEILRLCAAEQADVIVMATHGRSGVRRMLLGSVAAKVLHNADRPVLLVRAQEQPFGIEAAECDSVERE
jgi:nucleotide-binding universal stress UspA family protein